MHKSTLDMIKLIESRLPDILEGIAAELRLQSDEKLKCELLKGSPNNVSSINSFLRHYICMCQKNQLYYFRTWVVISIKYYTKFKKNAKNNQKTKTKRNSKKSFK